MMNIHGLSDEAIAGQRLMIGFDGTEWTRELSDRMRRIQPGGLILFSRNISNPGQLKHLCTSILEHAQTCGMLPPFIAVDQEGGIVARLKAPFTEIPGASAMKDITETIHYADITAGELLQTGFNMNMAPVLDVVPEDIDGVMKERVYGKNPYRVSKFGNAVILTFQKHGLIPVAKHFPGIGRTSLDSHIDLPVVTTPLEQLEKFDLVPFQSAIGHDVPAIMLSHIRYEAIDPAWPASLSNRIANHLLRKRMGFSGITLTDDLDMGAVQNHFHIQTVMERVRDIEIDIALVCHPGPKIESAFEFFLKSLKDDQKNRERAERSIDRILKIKNRFLSRHQI